jgi:hypothetical protein
MSREEIAKKWMDAQAEFGRTVRDLQAVHGVNPTTVPEALRTMKDAAHKLEAARKEYSEAIAKLDGPHSIPDAQTPAEDAKEAKESNTPIALPEVPTTSAADNANAEEVKDVDLNAFAKRLRKIKEESTRTARLEKAVREVLLKVMEKMEDAVRRGAEYYFTIWDHRFEDSCRTLTENELIKVEDKIVARFLAHAEFDILSAASSRNGSIVTVHAIQLRE